MPFAARCIAPPITSEKLAAYGGMLDSLPDSPRALKDSFRTCLAIVQQHKAQPETVTKESLPSQHDRNVMGTQFDSLPSSGPHRDPAFHLLWYVNELAVGRNPSAEA